MIVEQLPQGLHDNHVTASHPSHGHVSHDFFSISCLSLYFCHGISTCSNMFCCNTTIDAAKSLCVFARFRP